MKGVKEVRTHAGHVVRRRRTAVLTLAVCAFTSLTLFTSFTTASQSQKPSVFRARVDLMQLDVTVLDKKGVPVRGLTKDDFTLLEDNRPQAIEGFTAIDVADRVVEEPVWSATAPRDVTTNVIDNQRITVLVLDDALGMGTRLDNLGRETLDAWGKREGKKAAELLINSLGPQDLAAVVFTGMSHRSNQNLTADRSRLLSAVRAYPDNDANLLLKTNVPPLQRSQQGLKFCRAHKEILRTLEAIVNQLSVLPDRRKAIVYFGANPPWAIEPTSDVCGTYWMWRDVFVAAQRSNVTINPVDVQGLKPRELHGLPVSDILLTVADTTGGKAIVNTNDFTPGIHQILQRNSSYYLLAYQPTKAADDGTFRRLTVKVNRPDVQVLTRRGYWSPRAKPVDQAQEETSPQVEAIAGILPQSKLKLRATAAVFAISQKGAAAVAFALGIRQSPLPGRTSESVEVLITSFTADGDPINSETQVVPIMVPAARADAAESRYDVLGRIELPKPGKYELRLSAHSGVSDTRGSVYLDLDVPDFRKDRLSLSGIVVNALPGSGPTAPARLLNDLTPVAPTTERIFATTDLVTVFFRLYQGGNDQLAPVLVKTRVLDAAGKAVVELSDTVSPDRFEHERAADFPLRLPLGTLTAGEYLLTFEASIGRTVVRRDVQFQLR